MTEIARYLEGVKAKLDIKSDTQLAIRLGVSQAAVQKWMKTGAVPDDDMCLKIAEIAADDPAMVILLAHKSRASEATKKHWARIFKTVTAATFSLLLVAAAALPAVAAQAENLTANIHYQTRRFFKWLFGFSFEKPAFVSLLLFIFLSVALPTSSKANDFQSWRDRSNSETSSIVLYPDPAAPADRSSWTRLDTALELSYQVARFIDWRQTRYIADHPEQFTETNMYLGDHPNRRQVDSYMFFLAASHAAISYLLDRPARTLWQSVTIIEVSSAVYNNHRIGIAYTAHF